MSLHRHKKHWLFHASMWVCAFCVLLAFGFVSWKFYDENRTLTNELNQLAAQSGNLKAELSSCTKKKTGLEKSVEGIVEENIASSGECKFEPNETSCNEQSCLFRVLSEEGVTPLVGFISVKGHQVVFKGKVYDFEKDTFKDVECPAIAITSGPEFWMKERQSSLSADQPNVIPLPPLSAEHKKKMNQSTKDRPVTVDAVISQPFGHDGGPCVNNSWHIINVK